MESLPGLYFFIFAVLPGWSIASNCGGSFSISGSASTNRLARKWAESYQRNCPGISITVQDTSSSTGVAQVCGVRRDAPAVDVATTNREMNRLEALSSNGWQHQCQFSTRKTVQVSAGNQRGPIHHRRTHFVILPW